MFKGVKMKFAMVTNSSFAHSNLKWGVKRLTKTRDWVDAERVKKANCLTAPCWKHFKF